MVPVPDPDPGIGRLHRRDEGTASRADGIPGRLDDPLAAAQHDALPWATARPPPRDIGGWVPLLDDQDTARAHACATFPANSRAFQLVADIYAWHARLS